LTIIGPFAITHPKILPTAEGSPIKENTQIEHFQRKRKDKRLLVKKEGVTFYLKTTSWL